MTEQLTKSQQLQEKISDLQAKLLANDSMMPVLLREIHTKLREDAEVVTLLTDEEIGVIVSGLSKQMGLAISAKAVKESKSAGGKAKLSQLTIDDL